MNWTKIGQMLDTCPNFVQSPILQEHRHISWRTWVGLTLIWDVPRPVGRYCSYLPTAQAGRGNSPNQSQPNRGSPADVSPCRVLRCCSFLQFYGTAAGVVGPKMREGVERMKWGENVIIKGGGMNEVLTRRASEASYNMIYLGARASGSF